ncbi:MAG TPA: amino acid adenylation domain-containing protein [Ktedonobacteraceae bacterium]|nr:amino acid adenylation domain-containing protein [Ktedonobacteraceae bacterium]
MDQPANAPISALSLAKKRALLADLLHKKAGRPQAFPLSFAQQRLWFLHQMAPDNPVYNVSSAIAITGPLQKQVLERSLNALVRRHQILRTRFVVQEGQPVQQIDPPQPLSLPVVDLTGLSATEREAQVPSLCRQEARRPFDLAQGPLLRLQLLRLDTFDHLLLLSLHHILADGWSLGILFHELGALYAAFCADRPAPLPAQEFQYAHFARWQHEDQAHTSADAHLTYWKQHLAEMPPLTLPADHARSATQTFAGASEPFHLSPDLTGRLKALSQRAGVTLFMTLMAGFSALLARSSGQEDIGVGTVIANRTHSELERVIGFFANTLVLRTNLAGDPTVYELLRRVRETALGAYAHQDTPFERLVEELHPQRDLGQNPLVQTVLILQNAPYESLELPGLKLRLSLVQNGTSKFDLLLSLWESADGLSGLLEYSTDLFDASTICRFLGHYQQVLVGMVTRPEQPVSALQILTQAEQEQLRTWNATEVVYARDFCLPELFEQQVERVPDTIALVFEDHHCTYRELNVRANQLAHHLQRLGVGPDVCVGVCLERSLELVVGLLGILKAGGAYVPIDPTYPLERIALMLADTQASLVLTQSHVTPALSAHQAKILCLDIPDEQWTHYPRTNPAVTVAPDNLAYVIYTSGSTGQPKGVMNTHRGIGNRLLWMQEAYALTASDRVLQKTPFSFDVSVWEFFWPLVTGAMLVIAHPEGHKDRVYLRNLIREQRITTLHFVPSMLQVFLEEPVFEDCQSLRQVMCSGETLLYDLQQRFFAQFSADLHNLYGPTEAAIDVTFWACQPAGELHIVPIGYPIANTQIYLLDSSGNPVPVGVVGELYIGGVGVARGYLNRPDLSAERFVPDPFSGYAGARLYRTGDLARYLPNGAIEYLGRLDHQVKIRGFRIEPGEIEATLGHHPAVRDVAVIARDGMPGERRLIAYLVLHEGQQTSHAALRSFVKQWLPEYMIPAVFILLEAFPLTPNGKLDRQALPAPEEISPTRDQLFEGPRTPLEEQVAALWATVLGVSQISLRDTFFDLGGHSLLATQLLSRVEKAFDIMVPLRTIFEKPTFAEFVEFVRHAQQTRWQEMLTRLDALSEEEVESLLREDSFSDP